jgi:hypothetical protein
MAVLSRILLLPVIAALLASAPAAAQDTAAQAARYFQVRLFAGTTLPSSSILYSAIPTPTPMAQSPRRTSPCRQRLRRRR